MKNFTLPQNNRTYIMGVLNVTPDSFSDGGKYLDPRRALERALLMIEEGVDIIDVGGESSRPGSEPVSADEELRRVMSVVRALRKRTDIPISVDTWKSEVAHEVLKEGVSYINDITALRGDGKMAATIASFGAGVVLMHMKGEPKTMQFNAVYDDVLSEVMFFLEESVKIAERSGIDPDKIIIDPGIGFGKTVEHNLLILKNLQKFKRLGKPVLVGVSRKSFIGEITGRNVEDRAFGTAAGVAVAVMNGADMVRVHDVRAMRDAAGVADAIAGGQNSC